MAIAPGRIYAGSNYRLDILLYDDFETLTDPTTVTFIAYPPCGG